LSEFVRRLARLPDDRRAAFLRQLRQERTGPSPDEPELGRRAGSDGAPASHGQEQLWFLDQLAPGAATYNVAFCLRFTGPLDTGALISALRAVVDRHQVLRCRLEMIDGTLTQLLRADSGFDVPIVEATAAEAQRIVSAEARRPFDLTTGPLARALLVRTGPAEHLLVLTVHHIAFDGWSFAVLGRELAAGYNSYAAAALPRLDELPVQYADYAAWQRERLSGPRLEELTSYWRRALDGDGRSIERHVIEQKIEKARAR